MVQLSNVATPPQAQVITSQPGTTTNVVVMTGQPVTSNFINVNPYTKPWSSGICSCFDDLETCEYALLSQVQKYLGQSKPRTGKDWLTLHVVSGLCVTFCGICTAMRASNRLGENPCVPCCVSGAMVTLRTKLRLLLGIQVTNFAFSTVLDTVVTLIYSLVFG